MKKLFSLVLGLALSTIAFCQAPVSFEDAGQGYDKTSTTEFHFTVDNSISHAILTGHPAVINDFITVGVTDNGNGHDLTLTLAQGDQHHRVVVMRYFSTIGVAQIHAEGTDHILEDFMSTYIVL